MIRKPLKKFDEYTEAKEFQASLDYETQVRRRANGFLVVKRVVGNKEDPINPNKRRRRKKRANLSL